MFRTVPLSIIRSFSLFHTAMVYVVCPKSSCSAMPWNCAPRIRTWGPNCQRGFLRGGFQASERSCASRATGIVGGEAMDSPPRQCPHALCINLREFLARNSITLFEHPPYSPDLAPCDFFLFPKCKLVLRGRHLGDVTTIKSEVTSLLQGLRAKEFQRCF